MFGVIAFILCAMASCTANDHADWGSSTVGGNNQGSDNTSTDGQGDAGQDTDQDTSIDENTCAPNEILQINADKCWRRCPAGQYWDGTACVGRFYQRTWAEAQQACTDFDSRYHLATRADIISLLSNCDLPIVEQDLEGFCMPCLSSPICQGMFGADTLDYWTSTFTQDETSSEHLMWGVSFGDGFVFAADSGKDRLAIRCLRSLY
ncbi:MAG: hypothetical protein QNJ97_03745 [Myxococcota bacterium]|nr:hypothetical protein [Myxococcota bacterium]